MPGAVLHELDQAEERRYVQVGIVAVAGIQVGVRLGRPDEGGLLIVVDGKLEVVTGGVCHFEDACEPEVDIVRKVGKLCGELLAKKADLVRRQRMVPEEKAIRFDILYLLRQCGLEHIEDLVEVG